VRRRPGGDARCDGEMGGDPKKINPLQPVELVIDHSVQVDRFARRRVRRKRKLEFERNANATRSSSGASTRSTTSAPCRPTRASCIKSTSSISRASSSARRREVKAGTRGRVSRHRRRHRFAHDDGQRSRRARVGRRRHRSGSRDARPAGHDADSRSDRLQADGASCAKASPRPTSCSRSPRCCARRASSASSSSSSAPGLSNLGVADRVTIGNMSPEYGSTVAIFPIDDQTLAYLR
jgi:aconitate hydratase